MYRRPDTDIFGTKNIEAVVKIKNDSYVDPNEAFKKKNDENYQLYANRIGNAGRKNIQGNPQMTKVNQKVNFNEQYHKNRKQKDMQSSIFYEQNPYPRPQTSNAQRQLKQKESIKNQQQNISYGRKNTFKRQIDSLPYNQSQIKGNQSQLFDFNRNIQSQQCQRGQKTVLIPHQMQWDQHDSIKYNHHKKMDRNSITNNESTIFQKQIEQTKSIQNQSAKKQREQTLKILDEKNTLKGNKNSKSTAKVQTGNKKIGNESAKKQMNPITHEQMNLPNNNKPLNQNNDVQIQILKGWDPKYLQGLTKYCKLYSTAMSKFQMQGQGKAMIHLKRTKRWQAVSDWLTKDAKLKIRVVNP